MHKAIFKNCSEAVIDFIEKTQHSLQIGMCWFTHPGIFEVLNNACLRGIHVSIALDYDHINFHPRGLDFGALETKGAIVWVFPGPGLLHHKFAVSDERFVLMGSYNWTRSTQTDYVTIVHDAPLAGQFKWAFDALIDSCKPLEQLRHTTPRILSFAQLYQPNLWSVHDLRRAIVSGAKTWITVVKTELDFTKNVNQQRHCLPLPKNCVPVFNDAFWDEQVFERWLQTSSIRPALRVLLKRYCQRIHPGDVLVAALPGGKLLGAGIVGSGPEQHDALPDTVSRFVQWIALDKASHIVLKGIGLKSGVKSYKGSALELMALIASFLGREKDNR